MPLKIAFPGTIAASLLLAGCAAIPGLGPAPVDAFDISAPLTVSAPRKFFRTQILVPEPVALKLLDGEDIAVRLGGNAVQLLKGARWADRLPKLVQARVIEAFQRSNSFAGVGRPGEGLAIDYQIVIEIRAFEVRVGEGGGDVAHVELFVRLLDDRNGTVRASRSFQALVPVTGEGSDAFVSAMNHAFQKTAVDIVRWTSASI